MLCHRLASLPFITQSTAFCCQSLIGNNETMSVMAPVTLTVTVKQLYQLWQQVPVLALCICRRIPICKRLYKWQGALRPACILFLHGQQSSKQEFVVSFDGSKCPSWHYAYAGGFRSANQITGTSSICTLVVCTWTNCLHQSSKPFMMVMIY